MRNKGAIAWTLAGLLMLSVGLPHTGWAKSSGSLVCHAADLNIRQLYLFSGLESYESEGQCKASREGSLITVQWSYSTAKTRRENLPPIPYEATMAWGGNQYELCSVTFFKNGEADTEVVSTREPCR